MLVDFADSNSNPMLLLPYLGGCEQKAGERESDKFPKERAARSGLKACFLFKSHKKKYQLQKKKGEGDT